MRIREIFNKNRDLLIKPLLSIFIITCICLGIFLIISQHYKDILFENVEKQYRQGLINIVSVARNSMEPILVRVRIKEIGQEEAIRQIRQLLRNMTYKDQDGNNYVFMSSYNGIMLVQPFEPAKELTNQLDLKDVNGLFIIRELIKAAQTQPDGSFVSYRYYLPGVHEEQEKMAYVVGLPEIGCYIGTGMYMKRIILVQKDILTKVNHAFISVFIAFLVPISVSIFFILGRNKQLLAEIEIRKKSEEHLQKSEEKYRSIFEDAVEGIYQTAPEGRFISVNPTLARMAGYENPQEMINTITSPNQYYADSSEREKLLKIIHQTGFVRDHIVRMKRKDGSVFWASVSSRIVKNASGGTLYYEGTVEDMSAKRQAEEEATRLAAIVRNSREMVNLIDMEGYIVFQNEASANTLGIDQSDMQKIHILQIIPDHLKLRVEKEIFPALLDGGYWEGDLQYVNFRTRKIIDVHVLTFTIDDPYTLNSKYFANISLDISQRKLFEERFTKIFMMAPDMIGITRMNDGLIADVNLGFEQITGWKRDEVIGRTVFDINFWVKLEDRELMVAKLKMGKDIIQHEVSFRRKDGSTRTGMYSARPIHIGNEQQLIFVMQDITDRIHLEEERRRLEQQLNQSQKMDAIGQLAGGVAHDFNNILMGIQGNASLMRMEYTPTHPHYQRLSRIEEDVQRGAHLTKQLLGFARGGKYEVRTLAINDLVQKNTQFFIETRKEIDADFQLQPKAYPIEADAGQLEQVFLNIYINAGHAMPKGGHLRIETSNVTVREPDAKTLEIKPGNYVKISISDTGTGMDNKTLSRIFEPFFTTKAHEGGTGLGLASAYGIIRNHGGNIKVYSELGQGTTFNIYLPSSEKTIMAEETTPPDKDVLLGSGGILLVDDEPSVLEITSEMLKILGYSVFKAESAQDAVSIYREKQGQINLVLLDMILQGTSGSQVLQMLKTINSNIKVILSSGYSMQGEVQNVMNMGCLGFIQKPYNFTELSRIIHNAIGQADAR